MSISSKQYDLYLSCFPHTTNNSKPEEKYHGWLGWGKGDGFQDLALAATVTAQVLRSCWQELGCSSWENVNPKIHHSQLCSTEGSSKLQDSEVDTKNRLN